jgi:hypothetical protein
MFQATHATDDRRLLPADGRRLAGKAALAATEAQSAQKQDDSAMKVVVVMRDRVDFAARGGSSSTYVARLTTDSQTRGTGFLSESL